MEPQIELFHQISDVERAEALREGCIQLLNSHWPRSEGARRRVFEDATQELPHFVILSQGSRVVGYIKISDCSNQEEDTALLESLIVDESERGKGYGKRILAFCEAHALKCGFRRMALSTKDKQGYYEYLGYTRTEKAITAMGNASKFLDKGQLSGLQSLFGGGATKTVPQNITWYRKDLS